MKGPIVVALVGGTLAVIAFGGMAMASESADLGVSAVVTDATDAPDQSGEEASHDLASPDTGGEGAADGGGLVCVLVPITTEGGDAAPEPTSTIDELLAANDISCTGTGNERSGEVALVPRYLAHSGEDAGAEKGLAISSWAKSHANQESDDEAATPEADDAPDGGGEIVEPAPASPGRSGDAPGNAGSNSGNGRGH